MKPEEAFRAPLNTTKLAPVTVTEHRVNYLYKTESGDNNNHCTIRLSPVRVLPGMLLACV